MNRLQEVKKLYPNHIDLALTIADPKHKNKYLKWIASQLESKHNPEDIKSTVNAFDNQNKRLSKADIYAYKDLKDLENEIKNLESSKRYIENISKEMGSIKLCDDDNFTLIRINSKTAILYYGKASRWCVAMKDEDYWEEYSTSGNIFYILLDKKNKCKYAIQKRSLSEITIWKENDQQISVESFLKKNKEFEHPLLACIKDRVEPMMFLIKNDQAKREDVINWMKYQEDSTIKYLKKYNKKFYYYSVELDVFKPDYISDLNNFSLSQIKEIQNKNPKYIEDIVLFLNKNPKIKVHSLRLKIGELIENPNLILGENDTNFILAKKDNSIYKNLLLNKDKKIWNKALKLSNPNLIMSVLPLITEKTKKIRFLNKLRLKTDFSKLIDYIISSEIVLPENVWTLKNNHYDNYGDNNNYTGCNCETCRAARDYDDDDNDNDDDDDDDDDDESFIEDDDDDDE